MKKISIALLAGFITGVLTMVFVQPMKPRIPKPVESTERNSFRPVTELLNKGGDIYAYLGTEEVMDNVEDRIEGLKDLVLADDGLDENRQNEIKAGFEMVNRLVTHSGLTEISGIGISTIKLPNRYNHSRMVLHHYSGDDTGLIWNLVEDKHHPLEELDLLPANTVAAAFSDLRFSFFWNWLKRQVGESDIFPFQKVMVIGDTALKMRGINLDELFQSLQDRAGFIITIDPSQTVTHAGLEMPFPAMAMVIYVKDDTLFQLFKAMLPEVRDMEGMGKMAFKLRVPEMSLPYEPVVVQRGELLMLGTHKNIVRDIWEARKGKNRMKDSKEFKDLALDMPVSGNSFRFLSARFTRSLNDLHKKILFNHGETGEARWRVKEYFNPFPKDSTFFSVLQKSKQGFLVISNHNLTLENYLMIPVAVAVEAGYFFFNAQRQLEKKKVSR